MTAWSIIVIVAALLLLLFICRQEFVRANKARLAWRMAASILAVICLACMGLPLTSRQTNNLAGNEAIVVTEGANKDSVQNFNRDQKLAIYQVDDFFLNEHPNYDSLHVFGYGFSDDELQAIGGSKIILHPEKITNGITSIDWKRKIEKGKELLIQGTYLNQTTSPVHLLLNGFNTILDSFTIPAKQERSFQLHTIPKQNGKAVYSVLALHGKDTLEKDPVPIEVIAAVPLKIMMLAASPDFENKFLKDWLSQNGYAVVTKTTISTNKFDKTFFNTGTIALDRVSSSLLDSFDVLVGDELAILSLSKPEQENIYNQVSRKGMGMIIRSDTIRATKEWWASQFQLYTLPGKQSTHISLRMTEDGLTKGVLPVEQPLFIRSRNGIQPLITDSANNMVTGISAEGAGRIAFTTLNNTYSWLLAGNTANYYSIWSAVLQKIARQKQVPVTVETTPALPVVQQPLKIIVGINGNTFPVLEIDNKRIALAQDEKLSNRWTGVYWPLQAGWQTPVTVQGITNNWYVYGQNEWKYVAAQQKITATSQYSERPKETVINESIGGKSLPVPVPLVYFFIPFIICCGFLWMERKIF